MTNGLNVHSCQRVNAQHEGSFILVAHESIGSLWKVGFTLSVLNEYRMSTSTAPELGTSHTDESKIHPDSDERFIGPK